MKKEELKTKSILKRILSLFIINVMLILLFAPYLKVQATNISVSLECDSTTLHEGDEIFAKILINNDDITSMSGFIDYDVDLFEEVKRANFNVSENISGDWGITYSTTTKRFLIQEDNGDYYPVPGGIFATIKLKVKSDVVITNPTTVFKITTVIIDADSNNNYRVNEISVNIPETTPPVETHNVTYNYLTNGGTSSNAPTSPVSVAKDALVDLTYTANKGDGYTCIGWNTEANAQTVLTSLPMGTEDITLYAIYRKPVTVEFKYYDGESMKKSVTGYLYNNQVTTGILAPETGVEDSEIWHEMGWTQSTSSHPSESSLIAPGASISISPETAPYYMVYKKDINVTYDSNGGRSLQVTSIPGLYVTVNSYNILDRYSTSILPVRITTEKPVRTGYKFIKWNTMPNGRGTDYFSGQDNVQFSENTVLYAIWEEETEEPVVEEPYLKSEAYKIGTEKEQDIDEYQTGDEYISRVMFKTTIKAFLLNLSTNYTNKEVYDLHDNKIIDYYQYVGTGMKIKLTKEGWEDIVLDIAVVGDSDGDGEVTAADLADSIQCTLDAITLNDMQYIALDIDEDGEITAEDLADEIQFTLM